MNIDLINRHIVVMAFRYALDNPRTNSWFIDKCTLNYVDVLEASDIEQMIKDIESSQVSQWDCHYDEVAMFWKVFKDNLSIKLQQISEVVK